MRVTRLLDDVAHTDSLGEAIARALRPGDVVALDGPLGAGKTTLARAIAAAWGVDPARVSSPTFVLMHEYEGARGPLIHIDAYRMTGPGDLVDLDLPAFASGAPVLIEWAERLGAALPGMPIRVRLEHAPGGGRRAAIDLPDDVLARPEASALARGDTTCPVTGARVPASAPAWPFSSDRARLADLHRWFSGEYGVPAQDPPDAHDA